MKALKFLVAMAAFAVASILFTAPASAQATRTWVSGVGDDVNPCSRTAPCKTFAGAISKTATGGEINCLDPGGYGVVTIIKSITLSCKYTHGSILSSGTNGIVINTPAGSVVRLTGIDINGVGTGLDGIRFVGQGELHVEDVSIQRVTSNGIEFLPNGKSELYVSNTRIGEAAAEGVLLKLTGSSGINAVITRSEITNSGAGILVDGTGNTLPMNLAVANSLVSANGGNGITAKTIAANSQVRITVLGSTITSNVGSGLRSEGAASSGAGSSIMFVGDSTIFANVTGASTSGQGVIQSFKTNMISHNGTDGTPLTAFPGPGGTPLQ